MAPEHAGRLLAYVAELICIRYMADEYKPGRKMPRQVTATHLLCRSKWWNKMEMTLMVETDPSEIINELIKGVRKGGRIGVVGVYAGYANHYNIGAFMVCCVLPAESDASQGSLNSRGPRACALE